MLALKAALLALGCMILAACASTGSGLPQTAGDTFARVCREAPTAYAVFVAYDAVKPVSAETRRVVRASYGQITKTCANPPADVATAAVVVSRAIIRVRNAAGRA